MDRFQSACAGMGYDFSYFSYVGTARTQICECSNNMPSASTTVQSLTPAGQCADNYYTVNSSHSRFLITVERKCSAVDDHM